MIPHLARLFIGDNNVKSLPLAGLIGAIFLARYRPLARNLYIQKFHSAFSLVLLVRHSFWVLIKQKGGGLMLKIDNLYYWHNVEHSLLTIDLTHKKRRIDDYSWCKWSGKSTLLNCIAGLLKPKSGQILLIIAN